MPVFTDWEREPFQMPNLSKRPQNLKTKQNRKKKTWKYGPLKGKNQYPGEPGRGS